MSRFEKLKDLFIDLKDMLIAMMPVFVIGIIMCCLVAFHQSKKANANERPNWAIVYNEEYKCNMNTRHYILYLYSRPDKIKIKKHGQTCKVVSGEWSVLYNNDLDDKNINNLNKIEIDHIVPWSYLKQVVGEKDYKEVFNLFVNLIPVDKNYNRYKSNKICEERVICDYQRQVCGLIKVELEAKKIKNTIDCNIFIMR